MKMIRESNEDEMILEFLKGEIKSNRFSEKLLETIKQLGLSEDIILKANLKDNNENEIRKNIMYNFRGYPNKSMFKNFPQINKWELVQFDRDDINSIYYINYDYWNELSNNTSLAIEAAKLIKRGIEIYEVSNQPFIDGLKYLRENKFPPIILITSNDEKFLIVEGHFRVTIYGLEPELFNNSFGFVGYCSMEEMKKYDNRMI